MQRQNSNYGGDYYPHNSNAAASNYNNHRSYVDDKARMIAHSDMSD